VRVFGSLKLRRGEDGPTCASLDQHSALESIRCVTRQNNRLWHATPAADANELTHDVAMRNGATAILTGADCDLDAGPFIRRPNPIPLHPSVTGECFPEMSIGSFMPTKIDIQKYAAWAYLVTDAICNSLRPDPVNS
jgi:hypothetical protein